MCADANADTCIVDSLKDAACPISEESAGSGWNRARQKAIVAGTELVELHHPRKPTKEQSGKKAPDLADLYGSRWIAAGSGSVVMLHGEPGDPIVEMHHRKPVMAPLAPLSILIRQDGTMALDEPVDLLQQARLRGANGITVDVAAHLLFGDKPTKNEKEKARRKLESLEKSGLLVRVGGSALRGDPVTWFIPGKEPGLVTVQVTHPFPALVTAGSHGMSRKYKTAGQQVTRLVTR